jgi:PspC domain-containing protein
MESIHSTFAQAGLVRPQEGRVLAGVIAGLGRRIGLDPWPPQMDGFCWSVRRGIVVAPATAAALDRREQRLDPCPGLVS